MGPRVFLLLAAGVLAAAALIPLIASGRARPRPTLLGGALLALVASHLASTVAGLDTARSLWGTPERMHSLPLLLAGIAWFLGVSWTVRRREDWRVLLRVAAGAGALIAMAAVLELADVLSIPGRWPDRAASLLGNPVFLGAHGLWIVFAGGVLAAWETGRRARIAAGCVAALGVVAVVASGSRGPAIALVVGGVVAALAAAEALRDRPALRRRALVATALVVLIPGATWVLRDAPVLRDIPLLARAGGETRSGSAAVRRFTWGIASRTARDRPWLGVGPNNYAHAFNFFYRPEIATVSRSISADDAHNAPLQAAAERGIPGALITLLLLMAPAVLAVRALERGRFGVPVAAGVLGFTVAHFVHLLFAFDEVNGQAMWLALLALADGLDERVSDAAPRPAATRATVWGGWVAALAGLAIVVLPDVLTERRIVRAQAAMAGRRPDAAALFAATADAPHPRRTLARLHLARLAIVIAATGDGDRKGLIEQALVAADEAHAKHPKDIRPALVFADGARMAVPAGAFDDPVLAAAESLCVDALEWAPARQDLRFAMARVLLEAGRYEEAVDVADEAFASSPGVPWVLAESEEIDRLAAAGERAAAGEDDGNDDGEDD